MLEPGHTLLRTTLGYWFFLRAVFDKAIYLGNENYPWFIRNPSWAALQENQDYRAVLSDLKETYRLNRARWERMPAALPA